MLAPRGGNRFRAVVAQTCAHTGKVRMSAGSAAAGAAPEANGEVYVQPRPSLSQHSASSDEMPVRASNAYVERGARASNASPLERVVPLGEAPPPENSTRKASMLRGVVGANIASRRLTRASTTKLDLSSGSSRRKTGEDPEASFQVRLRHRMRTIT